MRTALLAVFLCLPLALARGGEPVTIGSKSFTESYVLAELMAQTLEDAGMSVERRYGLGGTLICYEALRAGEIDVYPEYTGTIAQAILALETTPDLEGLQRAVKAEGLTLLAPFGFDNTYALVAAEEKAATLGLERISDLGVHSELRFAFSHEFRNRPDGWPGLARTYALPQRSSGIEHALAYRALQDGRIDVTDAYSTDGELVQHRLRVLLDDRNFFPEYLAVPLARDSLPEAARRALESLGNSLDAATMRTLNARAAVSQVPVAEVVSAQRSGVTADKTSERHFRMWQRLARNTATHLELTGIALALASIVGLGTGIVVHRSRRLSRAVLYLTGLLQTIPSIALLALMIPLFGIGRFPAIVALFLYSLLPIVRNTITALTTIDRLLRKVARAMGLTPAQQIRHLLLPMALPHVLAGVRTAAVISIGTATLAAFIGAGGLGEPIVTGLTLNDTGLILQGAIPAAVLAILTELAFELLERRLVPAHMLSSALGPS